MADKHSGSPGAPTAASGQRAGAGSPKDTDDGQIKQQARQAATQAQDQAREVVDQAKDQAREVADQARGQVRSQVDDRSTQLGERASGSADDLRSVGSELRNQGKDAPARIADEVADRVERLGSYLQRTDGDTLLHDTEDLARRNPWPVALGGLAIGFAASRLLRASSRDRHRAQSSGTNRGTPGALPQSTSSGPPGGPAPKRVPSIGDTPAGVGGGAGVGTGAGVGGAGSPVAPSGSATAPRPAVAGSGVPPTRTGGER